MLQRKRRNRQCLATGFLVLLGLHLMSTPDRAAAADGLGAPVEVIPGDRASEDRFLGDWQGNWSQ